MGIMFGFLSFDILIKQKGYFFLFLFKYRELGR